MACHISRLLPTLSPKALKLSSNVPRIAISLTSCRWDLLSLSSNSFLHSGNVLDTQRISKRISDFSLSKKMWRKKRLTLKVRKLFWVVGRPGPQFSTSKLPSLKKCYQAFKFLLEIIAMRASCKILELSERPPYTVWKCFQYQLQSDGWTASTRGVYLFRKPNFQLSHILA